MGTFLHGTLQLQQLSLLFFIKMFLFFSVGDVIFYFEKPPNTFSLYLEFKNLSSSMIFFIGSRCHLFLLLKCGFFFSW